jgi:signal peptidase I
MSSIYLIAICILGIKTFIVAPFLVHGNSMSPTYLDDTYIIVDKVSRNFERGDVVIIVPHISNSTRNHYVKRIIGMPWDQLQIQDGYVYLLNESVQTKLSESYLSSSSYGQTFLPPSSTIDTFNIPDDMYYMMGDNRTNSADSRHCFHFCESDQDSRRFVKKEDIVWKLYK